MKQFNELSLLKQVDIAKRQEYKEYALTEYGVILNDKFRDVANVPSLEELCIQHGYENIFMLSRYLHNEHMRKNRLKERITKIFIDANNNNLTCYFLTFTFNDSCISSTSELTRRRYITRTLKLLCNHYVANIDFGVDERYTQREHYHAFVSSNNIKDLIHYYYELTNSAVYIEKIRIYDNMNKSYQRISKYISKLTNHALKENALKSRYIFDRNNSYAL